MFVKGMVNHCIFWKQCWKYNLSLCGVGDCQSSHFVMFLSCWIWCNIEILLKVKSYCFDTDLTKAYGAEFLTIIHDLK